MICPYRMDEVHTCHNGKSYVYMNFAECYKQECPFWGSLLYDPDANFMGCRKAEKECLNG